MSEDSRDDAGSEEFVAELTNHLTSMLAYIRSLAPGGSGARDLLHEVNITLWQKRESYQLGTNFKAWASQTIRYHLLNHRRRLISHGWLIFDDDLIDRLSPELEVEPDELEERHLALPSCLLRLSSKDRELPHHRYATTASLQQYATATSRSAGTLKAILFNLRAALKLCIERRLQGATLQLLQGQARISPNSGASALIEGPSTLTLIARCETADSSDLAWQSRGRCPQGDYSLRS